MSPRHGFLKIAAVVISLIGASSLPVAAQSTSPSLFVRAFENPREYPDTAIGETITEVLTTELGRTGKYRIIERAALTELQSEIALGESGWVDPGTAAPRGRLLGAEYALLGRVTTFSYQETLVQAAGVTDRGASAGALFEQIADVRVDFRLVSTGTGEAIVSESGEGRATTTSGVSGMAVWGRFVSGGSFTTAEFLGSLVGRATQEAIDRVVRALGDLSREVTAHAGTRLAETRAARMEGIEGRILGDAGGGAFVVGLGRDAGLVPGDRLVVIAEEPITDAAGGVIYRQQKSIATLDVADVSMPDRALARLSVSGGEPGDLPREGDIVRFVAPAAAASPGSSRSRDGGGTRDDLEQQVMRGQRYLEDGYYAQAVESFRRAESLGAGDVRVLQGLVLAHIHLKDFLEAEAKADELLALGSSLSLPAHHRHFLGSSCDGELVIGRDHVFYRPRRGNHEFSLSHDEARGIELGTGPGSTLSHTLVVRWQDSEGKDKKFDLIVAPFVQPPTTRSPSTLPSAEVVLGDIDRLHRMILRLIQQ